MEPLTRDEFDQLVRAYEKGSATEAELEALEPYRAKRAVLLASGFGTRLLPATEDVPKPLVRVNGVRIIDPILDALTTIGVEDITIVVGYLGECFEELRERYPSVRIVHNPLFDSTNNISSAVAAANRFSNAYVFESDLLLSNPQLIRRYQYESNYLGVPVKKTPDWCFDVDDEGRITDLHKGGEDCWHMYGVSYWTDEDGKRLEQDLPKAFAEEANRQRFWDDVPCVLYNDRYNVKVRECSFDDICEVDTYDELRALDPSYPAV